MAAQPEKKDGYPLTRTTVSTAFLIACSCLTLTSCQAPESGTGPAGRETAPTDTSGTPSVGAEAVPDLSSATSNADGGPIVFDPVEAGKNLPDPCTELTAEVFREMGFTEEMYRTTHGLGDSLLGKGITCDLEFIDNGSGYAVAGIYADNLSKEFVIREGLFLKEASESIVSNAYYYRFSPNHKETCFIGAATPRGRIGLYVGDLSKDLQGDTCDDARKYFEKLYLVTDGFGWLGI
ncbi:DUF3558 domain-containing protein [Corynebacterium sp. P7202]|uniref:DUF3558 family protein n=1 Tax=Corynebacterium pygosceleis TaxID=2800406 RepID=UPI002005B3D9|nr:DUF3558 family protein [Corynebacterium pygosceleis]MCK7638246.1 DUF3558 domain-containing protein [Corynebacterium pygosceleis]